MGMLNTYCEAFETVNHLNAMILSPVGIGIGKNIYQFRFQTLGTDHTPNNQHTKRSSLDPNDKAPKAQGIFRSLNSFNCNLT